MGTITPKQQKIYDFIQSFTAEHGYPPSVREIGAAMGLKSPSTVHFHLKGLEEAGMIVKAEGKTRAITLPAAPNRAVAEDSNASIFMVSSHTFLAVLTRSSENRSYVRSQLRRVSDRDHALSVVLPPADVHPDGLVLQGVGHVLAPLHGAHAAPGQVVLPADVEQLLRVAQPV